MGSLAEARIAGYSPQTAAAGVVAAMNAMNTSARSQRTDPHHVDATS
jgi:hypothetical protein